MAGGNCSGSAQGAAARLGGGVGSSAGQGGGGDRAGLGVGGGGGLDPPRNAAFSEQPADPDVLGSDGAGGVALFGPADGQDDVAAAVGGAAERDSEPEQVP